MEQANSELSHARFLDASHVKLITYRIESIDEHFAYVSGNGGQSGSKSRFSAETELYWSEATVLIDHLATEGRVKIVDVVGGAQGLLHLSGR